MNLPVKQNNTGFNAQPKDMDQAMRLATMMANSALVPPQYKGKPEDTLIAMMMGSELGLNPMQAIQNIAVINNRPAIWGDALLALVQNHPKFGGIEETFDENTETATCTVWRKGGTKHTQTFSKKDAELAGLWGRNTWKQYPKRMLSMRARGFALRNQFADALLGLITAEEAQDIAVNDNSPASVVETVEQVAYYPQSDFDKNFETWSDAIKQGKATPERIISMVSSKGELTERQKEQILNLKAGEPA